MALRLAALFGCLTVALAGCSSSKTGSGAAPDGKGSVVGKWVPTGEEAKQLPEGAYLEFTAGGDITLNISENGKIHALEMGKYTVEGDKLNVTEVNNGKEELKVSTIMTLTADEFAYVNSKGEEKRLKRLK